MQKINDTPASPLRFITESGTIVGQFYNSKDKQYHLAIYVPYTKLPHEYLCGGSGNLSPSRSDGEQRKGVCCAGCAKKLAELSKLDAEAFKKLGFI